MHYCRLDYVIVQDSKRRVGCSFAPHRLRLRPAETQPTSYTGLHPSGLSPNSPIISSASVATSIFVALLTATFWASVPACSRRSRTLRAAARWPSAILDRRCACRHAERRSGRGTGAFQSIKEQAGSSAPGQIASGRASQGVPRRTSALAKINSLRAQAICAQGWPLPRLFSRPASATKAGFQKLAAGNTAL